MNINMRYEWPLYTEIYRDSTWLFRDLQLYINLVYTSAKIITCQTQGFASLNFTTLRFRLSKKNKVYFSGLTKTLISAFNASSSRISDKETMFLPFPNLIFMNSSIHNMNEWLKIITLFHVSWSLDTKIVNLFHQTAFKVIQK